MSKRKTSSTQPTCYICQRQATTREHVPPLCFFPEEGEFPGASDLRKNLITVPSCDEHNLSKSLDDQYLCTVLAMHFNNNSLAQAHFSNKIMRSLQRRPAMILGFFKGLLPASVRGAPSAAFSVDRPRFNRALDHIAKGVNFDHFGEKYGGRTEIISYSMFDVSSPNKEGVNKALREWKEFSDSRLAGEPKHGSNQSVFYYQFMKDEQQRKLGIRLVFYEGFVADVYFQDANPGNPSPA